MMTNGKIRSATAALDSNGKLQFNVNNGDAVNVCSMACTANFVGFFAGPNASHVGLGYDALSRTTNVFSINGVAVMKR